MDFAGATNYYIEYEEIRSETQYVSGGRGRVYFGKDQPAELINGSKALVLFISYPQSENNSSIRAVAVLHLKSSKVFMSDKDGGFEQFFKSHNLSSSQQIKKNASNVSFKNKPIPYFWLVVISVFLPIASSDNHPIVWCSIWGVYLIFYFLLRRSGSVSIDNFLSHNSNVVLEQMSLNAPVLWQELEAKQGG